jgi:uncharacterized protein (DUF736 family)
MTKKTYPRSQRVTIGKIRPSTTVEFAEYEGSITTIDINVRIAFFAQDKLSVGSADFQIMTKAADGEYMTIGSAWKKKGNTKTGDFFTLSINEPSFPYALNVIAFPKSDDVYEIQWERST